MTHTDLLNALIEKYNLKSYLEIGVQNPANNFDKIKCNFRTGTDPEVQFRETENSHIFQLKSDIFFLTNAIKFGLIFIDGLHHADQVKRDFENSLRCLSDNGFILIHDCLPEIKETTSVPRETLVWHGDVYKFAMTLGEYDGIDFKTFNITNGACLVWKDETKRGIKSELPKDWATYNEFGKFLLRVQDEIKV